jgi:hypothetical protein
MFQFKAIDIKHLLLQKPFSKHKIFVETILEWLGGAILGFHDHIIQQRPTTMFGIQRKIVRSKDKTCSKEDCEIKRQNMFKGRL